MGSYFNFNTKNFGQTSQPEGNNMMPDGNFPLARQSSVYSLTIDEFQNSLGGFGKDLGSMNMDELLRNIWTAEETQAIASSSRGAGDGNGNAHLSGNLQRQGSLTLPRTLSQKTVDEVWRHLFSENSELKEGGGGVEGSHMQQRQPTFGEITLEEFLVKAGVVREEAQPIPSSTGFQNEHSMQQHSILSGLNPGFQHSAMNNVAPRNQVVPNNNIMPSLPLNVSGARSCQKNVQPLFPKQANVGFASSMPLVNKTQPVSPSKRGKIGNNGFVQGSFMQSGVVAAESPGSQLSSDGMSKSNTSSVSPPSHLFGGGARARRSSGMLEKAMERRHRRMIKNRESAARSRARKQAYTLELEAELAQLKEINKELKKKQEEMQEMQENQITGNMNMSRGSKRRCLRRTLTGPW